MQLDTQSDFASVGAATYASWNDAGFDLTNLTFTPSPIWTPVKHGTGVFVPSRQPTNWELVKHLPLLATRPQHGRCQRNKGVGRFGASQCTPPLNLPHFTDTYVIANGSGSDATYENSTSLQVGEMSSGYQAAALIRIPLSEVPQPANARVTERN